MAPVLSCQHRIAASDEIKTIAIIESGGGYAS
jgi:hypothetical protein